MLFILFIYFFIINIFIFEYCFNFFLIVGKKRDRVENGSQGEVEEENGRSPLSQNKNSSSSSSSKGKSKK